MKFILISPKNRTTYNFRGDLLKEIASKGYSIIVTGPNNDNIEKIKELGVKFIKIPLRKNGINFVDDIRYFICLLKLFIKEKPDVTLGYTIKPVIYGAIAAKLAGVKNINSMITGVGYAFIANTIKAKIIRCIVKILYYISFKCADTVIFQNIDDLKEFVDMGLLKREKCRLVNGSGVNMDKFKPAAFPSTICFFMLSRIIKSKGIMEYLTSAKIIKSKYPDVRFMLLGAVENMPDALTKEDLDSYAREGIIDHYGETENVSEYYRQCSVYVLSSYREGTPRTVLEAMSMGRPIITTDAPGCRETVENGVNGFLVPVRDVVALVEKMEWFINNPKEVERMGNESYRICLEKFDVHKVNAKMLEYMNII